MPVFVEMRGDLIICFIVYDVAAVLSIFMSGDFLTGYHFIHNKLIAHKVSNNCSKVALHGALIEI